MKPPILTSPTASGSSRRVALAVSAALLGAVFTPTAFATTYTWDGGGANNFWNTAANWNPDGVPVSNSVDTSLVFDGTVQLSNANNISAAFLLNSLVFNPGAGAFNLAYYNGLGLSFRNSSASVAPTIVQASASNVTVGQTITLASGVVLTVAGSGAGSVTLSGINGGGSLAKTSSGTLILTGMVGVATPTVISAGTLQVGNGGTLGALGGDVTNNSTLIFNRSDAIDQANPITGSGSLTQKGAGTLTLYSACSYAGTTTISSGTLAIGNSLQGSLGTGNVINNSALVYNRSDDYSVANAMSGPGTFTKNGAGALTLAGDHSTTGLMTVNGGRLIVGSGGRTIGAVMVNAGATFGVSGAGTFGGSGAITLDGTAASPAALSLAGSGANTKPKVVVGDAGAGAATQSSGSLSGVDQGLILGNTSTGSGTYTLTGGSLSTGASYIGSSGAGVFNHSGGTFTTGAATLYLGYLAGGNGAYNLSGSGSLTTARTQVSDANATGLFTQTGGLHTTGVLSLSGGSPSSQGTYQLQGGTLMPGLVTSGDSSVSGTSIFNFNGGTLLAAADTNALVQGLTTANVRGTGGINNSGAIIDTQGFNVTIPQALVHSTIAGDAVIDGGLVKLGTGTLTLTGANTFTGPIYLTAGALAIASESNLGSASQVTVGGSGQLLFTASATLARAYHLGIASLVAGGGSNLTLNGATIDGGLLGGSGTFAIGAGTALNSLTTLAGSALTQASGSATMNAVTVRGLFSQTGGTLGLSNGLVLGSGHLSIGGLVNATDVEIQGTVTVGAGATLAAAGSGLYLTGGSRTTIAAGGTLAANGGPSVELNGSLLVNNGTQTGVLDVNFGSLAKGSGAFGTVHVTDGGRFSPGNSPGTATFGGDFSLGAGSRYDFELNQANYTPGDGHADFLSISGVLSFEAETTSNTVLTLGLSTLNASGAAAALPDFDSSQPYSFTLATAAGGISGFSPAEVAVDASGFLGNTSGGSFAVEQQGNNLVLEFTPVPEPGSLAALLVGAWLCGLGRRRRRTEAPGNQRCDPATAVPD